MAYMRLGDLLVSSGVITNEQLEKALEMQKETKERLGDPTICMELTKKDEGCTLKHGVPRGAHAQGRGAEPWPRLARPRQLSDDGSAARGQDSMSESVQPLYVAVQKEHTAVCSALEQLEK